MGYLKIAGSDESGLYAKNIYHILGTGFQTEKEVGNLIRYILRCRDSDDPNNSDLCAYNALGFPYDWTVPELVHCICFMQNSIKGTNSDNYGSPRMFHEILWFDKDELERTIGWTANMIGTLAYNCALSYFNRGHQVVFGVHRNPITLKYHIHFAVNTVNFLTGKKFHTNLNEQQREREREMNQVFDYLKSIYH